jgi:hypothetical protein
MMSTQRVKKREQMKDEYKKETEMMPESSALPERRQAKDLMARCFIVLNTELKCSCPNYALLRKGVLKPGSTAPPILTSALEEDQ